MPARESAYDKGRRLLAEGRLTVKRVDLDLGLVIAECKGDTGQIYDLGHDPKNNQWRCTCREMKGKCSHLTALHLVTPLRMGGIREHRSHRAA